MRSQEEIAARIGAIKDHDMLGFQHEVLVGALDWEHAQVFLKPGTSKREWDRLRPRSEVQVRADALHYLKFAMGKIADHRGISAVRSVDKMHQYAWLLGCDDIDALVRDTPYGQYGAPIVRATAVRLGGPFQAEWVKIADEPLNRMAEGKPCTDGCAEGCER